jgi:hypothetical protein
MADASRLMPNAIPYFRSASEKRVFKGAFFSVFTELPAKNTVERGEWCTTISVSEQRVFLS